MESRERNINKVSRLSIILNRFTRYIASSEGYYLREVNLFFISGVLFTYVAGELKVKNDITVNITLNIININILNIINI
jgi:hypothetical protein